MVRPRNWTDDQLRSAVTAAATWGDVIRGVGRVDNVKARRTVQGHAVRLGLDVTHLPTIKMVDPIYPHDTGQRIRLNELAEVIPEVNSWAEAFRRLNLRVTGSGYLRLKAKARELEIDMSHFRGQGWSSKPIPGVRLPFTLDADERNLHKAAASKAAAWFLERGYMVSVPVEPAAYDMIVDSDEGLVRVQVKSTRSKDDAGRWLVRIYRQSYDRDAKLTTNGPRVRRNYSDAEIDYFFIVASDGSKYLIPLNVVQGIGSLTLDSKYAAFRVE